MRLAGRELPGHLRDRCAGVTAAAAPLPDPTVLDIGAGVIPPLGSPLSGIGTTREAVRLSDQAGSYAPGLRCEPAVLAPLHDGNGALRPLLVLLAWLILGLLLCAAARGRSRTTRVPRRSLTGHAGRSPVPR